MPWLPLAVLLIGPRLVPPQRARAVCGRIIAVPRTQKNPVTTVRRTYDETRTKKEKTVGKTVPLRRQAALARAPNRVLLATPLASADIRHQVPVYRKRARTF
jgi:hypothetical protein